MTYRDRSSSALAFSTHYEYNRWGFPNCDWCDMSGDSALYNTSQVIDETHPFPDSKNPDWDCGGSFTLRSDTWDVSPAIIDISDGDKYYRGALVPTLMAYINLPTIAAPTDVDLVGYGTTAIARTTPNRPLVDFSNDIGEALAGGLPAVPGLQALKTVTKTALAGKSAGSEYLNMEFGWKPLVSDLRKLVGNLKKSNKIISQYRKSSDTRIRRRYTFPTEETNVIFTSGVGGAGNLFPSMGAEFLNQSAPGSCFFQAHNKLWFSGAFKYHVPVGDDVWSRMKEYESYANKMAGLRLTPEVVWNLAPWTWAYDWFGNVGDIAANISNLGPDGMVLQYGYIMDENISSTTYTATFSNPFTGAPLNCAGTNTVKYLRRRGSTPYGFGFDMSGLTASQDAVVVALGISRSHR